jgi:hypothetical protein
MVTSAPLPCSGSMTTYGWSPQSGYTHIVFDRRNRMADVLSMTVGQGQNLRRVADFQVDWNMTAANSFNVIFESVGLRDG